MRKVAILSCAIVLICQCGKGITDEQTVVAKTTLSLSSVQKINPSPSSDGQNEAAVNVTKSSNSATTNAAKSANKTISETVKNNAAAALNPSKTTEKEALKEKVNILAQNDGEKKIAPSMNESANKSEDNAIDDKKLLLETTRLVTATGNYDEMSVKSMNEQLQSTDAEPRPQLSPEFLASSNWTSALGGAEIIVRGVNKREQRKWVAFPYHRFAELGILQRSVLAGVRLDAMYKTLGNTGAQPKQIALGTIPKHFDAREKWPQCAQIIGTIRDQSACGSCWAVSTGGMITDRLCIRRAELGIEPAHKTPDFMVSEFDILACSRGGDCGGGYPYTAVSWAARNRVVSGGNYSEYTGCFPYAFHPHSCFGGCYTPYCTQSCTNRHYDRSYHQDKSILGSGGRLEAGHMSSYRQNERIQAEIMARGPVSVSMYIHSDLYYYRHGIYEPTTPYIEGGHCVRIIGWGEGPDASGVTQPYWLVANSWNTRWGENGFFRIIRGTNAAGIERGSIDYLIIEAEDV